MENASIFPGKYVVLGASGLIGYHLLNYLKNRPGVEVKAVFHRNDVKVIANNIIPIRVDLTVPKQCVEVIKGADYVFCAAGIVASTPVLKADPIYAIQVNLSVAVNSIEAAWREKVKHFVWFSSTTAYPDEDEVIFNEKQMFTGEPPQNWYGLGWMTRYVEKFAFHLCEHVEHPLIFTAIRPSMVYGENDHFDDNNAHFLPAMIRRVIQRQVPIQIWGDGEARRDVVHGEDVARAAILAIERKSGYRAYNIAQGQSYSVNEIVLLICQLDDYENLEIEHLLNRGSQASQRKFDIKLAEKELKFCPQVTLEDGLKRTIFWYKKNLMSTELIGS